MPFDTTFHLSTGDQNLITTFNKEGGRDTDIYLPHDSFPPEMDSAVVSLIKQSNIHTFTLEAEPVYTRKGPKTYDPPASMVIIFLFIFIIVIRLIFVKNRRGEDLSGEADNKRPRPYLTYYGDQLGLKEEVIAATLTKYFSYYNNLVPDEQARFISRLKKFMGSKTFLIHDERGFREMPILISAAAVQLTFGLQKYLLPKYTRIHIYPSEYVAASTLHIIEGNVQGNTINFSWKHFLDGYTEPSNGQNVGLHEMAHALYAQTFLADENRDRTFENNYQEFNSYGKQVFDAECNNEAGLYSQYAKTNFQEFWAESIEIFFEKPGELNLRYPLLYKALKEILNQDPANA